MSMYIDTPSTWFPKPKGLNIEGEKLWNKIVPNSTNCTDYCVYLLSVKELDEFYCYKHFSCKSDYDEFVREREKFRLWYSLETNDELDFEKLIEVVVDLRLKIQEQEYKIESLSDEIRALR